MNSSHVQANWIPKDTINTSPTGIVNFTMRFTASLWFVCVASFGQAPEERRTLVAPLPDEEIAHPCEYRMILPETKDPIKAMWTIFDRGQDWLKWYQDRQVRAFAR